MFHESPQSRVIKNEVIVAHVVNGTIYDMELGKFIYTIH